MNPPFGEPVPDTKPYLRAAYPWLPGGADIAAAFVGRGIELCKPTGYLGAITSRAGLFITTFETWRRTVLLGNRLTVLADLGYRVMQQAKVEAAAYVVGPGQPPPTHEAVCIRILKEPDRAYALGDAIAANREGRPDRRVFHVPIADFELVPGSPLAYWLTPPIRRLFTDLPRLEGKAPKHDRDLRPRTTSDSFAPSGRSIPGASPAASKRVIKVGDGLRSPKAVNTAHSGPTSTWRWTGKRTADA